MCEIELMENIFLDQKKLVVSVFEMMKANEKKISGGSLGGGEVTGEKHPLTGSPFQTFSVPCPSLWVPPQCGIGLIEILHSAEVPLTPSW